MKDYEPTQRRAPRRMAIERYEFTPREFWTIVGSLALIVSVVVIAAGDA